MKYLRAYFTLAVLAMFGLVPTTAFANAEVVPIDNWSIRHAVNSVSVSPDGKHMLVLKLESKEGKNVIEIYKTDDLSKPYRRINGAKMELISGQWVSDNVIVGSSWRQNRKKVKGPEDGTYDFLFYAYNLEKNAFSKLENKKVRGQGGGFQLINMLPKEPDTVLIGSGRPNDGGTGVDPFQVFRPTSYYRFNTKTGSKTLVLKGNEKYSGIAFDNEGNPRIASRIDQDTKELIQYYRLPGDTSWKEFGQRYDLDKHENLYRVLGGIHGVAGLHPTNPKIAYVIDNRNGADKAALWEYDLTTGTYLKKLYENPIADVMGIATSSDYWGGNYNMVAAIYSGEKRERHWFDMEEKALYQQFESKIPNARQVSISSRSRDGQTMIVQNRGPKDPGSFWLVKNGKMAKLGSRNPLVKPSDLSNVEFIRYPARDGMMIPGYVTKPAGPGPHPLIVLPHGGPHVNEVITYDEWGQLLANNGYMVLQPQYRMSVGWGQKHFDTAFGQHGLDMQDDKDDGALYLVSQGLVDPNRIAMFGWSYGGYAALVAASRPENIYQCVVAGAAVADARKVFLKRSGGSSPKALEEWSRARGGFVGINPIDEIEKINVPFMMVHGDVDARVLYFNFKDYRKEVERVAKAKEIGSCSGGIEDGECTTTLYRGSGGSADSVVPVSLGSGGQSYTANSRFVTLKGADHFYSTLMFRHKKKFYTEMLDFLKNDCGPGGL